MVLVVVSVVIVYLMWNKYAACDELGDIQLFIDWYKKCCHLIKLCMRVNGKREKIRQILLTFVDGVLEGDVGGGSGEATCIWTMKYNCRLRHSDGKYLPALVSKQVLLEGMNLIFVFSFCWYQSGKWWYEKWIIKLYCSVFVNMLVNIVQLKMNQSSLWLQ